MEQVVELPESLLCELLRRFDTPELLALACTCKKLNSFVEGHVLPPGSEQYRKTKEAFLRQKLNRQRKAQRKGERSELNAPGRRLPRTRPTPRPYLTFPTLPPSLGIDN